MDDTASLELMFHSYNAAVVTAYFDDLRFVRVADTAEPPWEGQYKIRPGETDKLSAADVVGPDGIVYPNWTRCGVEGGIPDVSVVARIEDFGAVAGDYLDDAGALDRACRAVGGQGGGAVLLGAGEYMLDRPVTVRHDGVVIRGQGAAATRLTFRYDLPESGIRFYHPQARGTVGPATRIELHALPTGLQRLEIFCNEQSVRVWTRSLHSGNTFSTTCTLKKLVENGLAGPAILRGVATYSDGTERSTSIPVTLDADYSEEPPPSTRAAILFEGKGYAGPRIKLTRDARRGTQTVELETVEGLAAGDAILIDAPATQRWKELTRCACEWGTYRQYSVRIRAVNANTLELDQPLRLDFPTVDGSYVVKLGTVERCGIESLTIEQTANLWISTVLFRYGWNCWGKDVVVRKCGRFPIYGSMAKFCEIRDCVFDDAWFKGGGGTAYGGWEHSWDCLIDGMIARNLRHAPLFQWAASGCVIRNGIFHNSDAQWHSGWTNENLMENCVSTSRRGHGSYGFGMWASPPEDKAHGPNGPRNVVYNCDVMSEKTGLWMGGMNENWLILYNRFVVETGYGVFAKTASFDHIIKGNVFVLLDGSSPAINLVTPDCIGIDVVDNRVYGGGGRLLAGSGVCEVEKGNVILPLGDDLPPRPSPAVPSIYEWQRQNAK
jgi:hypothetical protein